LEIYFCVFKFIRRWRYCVGIREEENKKLHVVGVKNLAELQEAIVSYISEKTINCGKYTVNIISLEGKDLLVLAISELLYKDKPCYYKDLGIPRGACVRIGNVDKQITQEELTAFLQHSPSYAYDQTVLLQLTWKDLSSTKVDGFFQKSAERTGRVIPNIHISHITRVTFA